MYFVHFEWENIVVHYFSKYSPWIRISDFWTWWPWGYYRVVCALRRSERYACNLGIKIRYQRPFITTITTILISVHTVHVQIVYCRVYVWEWIFRLQTSIMRCMTWRRWILIAPSPIKDTTCAQLAMRSLPIGTSYFVQNWLENAIPSNDCSGS